MRSHAPRFTKLQREKMRDLYLSGYRVSCIARKFNCRVNAVWNNVFDLNIPNFLSKNRRKVILSMSNLTPKDIKRIRSEAKNKNLSSVIVADILNISQTAALSIIQGKTWRWAGGWTRPKEKLGWIYVDALPEHYATYHVLSDRKPGAKKGSKHRVKTGALLILARKYNWSTSWVCRKIRENKIRCPEKYLVHL